MGRITNFFKPAKKPREAEVHIGEYLGRGRQGVVHEAVVNRNGRTRRMAAKLFYNGLNTEAKRSYYELVLLRKLGFPTVPFPNLFSTHLPV
jgi:hypothetical protein